ncbi:hypothetical protein V1504DRAFT_434254, partial [Lipomyces starkeyi]
MPTLVISPWVKKGVIEHKGKNHGKEYTHTSMAAFIDPFFLLSDFADDDKKIGSWE